MDNNLMMKQFMNETGMSRMDAVYYLSHKKVMDLGQEVLNGRSEEGAVEFMFGFLHNMASNYEITNIERGPIFEFMMDVVLNNIKTIKSSQSQVSWIKRKMGVDRLVKSSMSILTGVTNKVQVQVNDITGAS
jgi:hypothetical protein